MVTSDVANDRHARIEVTYELAGVAGDAEACARRIALEQTVELPAAMVTDEIRNNVVGRVEDVCAHPARDGSSLAAISYDARLAGNSLSQLANLIFGNVSIISNVRLVNLTLPGSFLDSIKLSLVF